MDPGNWATDIAGGSAFGYTLLSVVLLSNLMAMVLQALSARLGIVAGLDERLQTSVDGYVDPWQDRTAPKSPAQFAPSLPLLPLPQVPVR